MSLRIFKPTAAIVVLTMLSERAYSSFFLTNRQLKLFIESREAFSVLGAKGLDLGGRNLGNLPQHFSYFRVKSVINGDMVGCSWLTEWWSPTEASIQGIAEQ